MKFRGVITVIFLLGFITCQAQQELSEGKFKFFSLKLHTGKHLYTGQELSEYLKNGYGAIELRYGWQSKGKNQWEREHKYPSYGIGWYSGYVGDTEIFGSPHALFGFMTFPLSNRHRNNLQVEPSLGLTYNLKPYNPDHNAVNDAIGAKLAVYFSLHFGGKYRVNREIDLLYGFDITHFSNGRMVTPNLGLNMAGISLGARYNFNALQRKVDKSPFPTTILAARPILPPHEKAQKLKANIFSYYQALGVVQNKDDAGTNHKYLTASGLLEYQHRFNTKHAIAVGFDALFDASARDTVEYKMNAENQTAFFPAAHIGYDFMVWRLTIRMQVGFHLTGIGREMKGTYFVRPAIRYDINKNFFAQIGLKTMNGATADWVEWGLGYKFFQFK